MLSFIKKPFFQLSYYTYKIYRNFQKTTLNLKYYQFKKNLNISKMNNIYNYLNYCIGSRNSNKTVKLKKKIESSLRIILEIICKISIAYEHIGDLYQSIKFKRCELFLEKCSKF
ncbi:hypothetical protein (nucleomorph) [Guillardia theta]|uniref:Uncharacterized protein n=1 Tax=Guillardia theta TaxID=55529 RepID=Q9SEA3_GUITH|nr:hypothetical protein GTHECHR1006 [Guillardia theta]AAF24213.1 hypothetical protein [Guillardia theta]